MSKQQSTAEIVAMVKDAQRRLGSVPGRILDLAVESGVMRRVNWNRWTWTDAVAGTLDETGASS